MPASRLLRAGERWILQRPPAARRPAQRRSAVVALDVSDRQMAEGSPPGTAPARAVLPRVRQAGAQGKGDGRRPHHRPQGRLGGVLRPKQSRKPVPQLSQQENGAGTVRKPQGFFAEVFGAEVVSLGARVQRGSAARGFLAAPSPCWKSLKLRHHNRKPYQGGEIFPTGGFGKTVRRERMARCGNAAGENGALRKCSGREIWRGERERKAKREPSCRGGGQDAQERRRQREKIPRCGSAERRVRFGHGRTVERMDEKREKVEGCMLGRTACGDCSRCGWNSAVAEKRKRAIRRSIQSEREQGAAGAQRKGAVQWRERDSRPSWS